MPDYTLRVNGRTHTVNVDAATPLLYVLRNGHKHGATRAAIDPFSSGAWFDGFAEHPPLRTADAPVHEPTVWLLTTGWRKFGGLIRAHELPATAPD